MNDTDLELLKRYAGDRAEDAFAELVRRHLDLVFSSALRQVRSPQLAEEVSQSVFTDLSRNAQHLARDTVLTAWLYQVTRRTAIDVVRREARRQLREQIATEMNAMNDSGTGFQLVWSEVEPLLDEAMSALDETDRAAVLLRYFENKSLREVGATLGTSDDAAQKRVSRAVERLREFFAKRAVTVGASGLVMIISANAVQAAPVGLAVAISTAAAITGTTITATATKAIAMTTLQKTLVAVVIGISLATPLLVQHRAQARLRQQEETSRKRAGRLAILRVENEGFSNLLALAKTAQPGANDQFNEVLKLRGEVGRLQATVQELTGPKTNEPLSREEVLNSMRQLYSDRVNRLKQSLAANPAAAVPELQYLTDKDWLELVVYDHHRLDPDGSYALSSARSKAQINFAHGALDSALRQYGKNNNGQFPTDVSQLAPYFKSPVDPSVLQGWAVLPTSSLPNAMWVDEPWVITQRAPVDAQDQRIVIGMKDSRLGTRSINDWIRND